MESGETRLGPKRVAVAGAGEGACRIAALPLTLNPALTKLMLPIVTNVTKNIPNLPPWGSLRSIVASRYDAATAYLTVDFHQVNNRLKSAPAGAVTVTILDQTGAVVRTLSAPASAGLNRVYWDLRYEPTSEIRMRTSPSIPAPHVRLGPTRVAGSGGRRRSAFSHLPAPTR